MGQLSCCRCTQAWRGHPLRWTGEGGTVRHVGKLAFGTWYILMWLTLVDIECEGPYCDPHHALTVVEELDGLCVQGKVPQVLYASVCWGGGGGGGDNAYQ